MPTGAELFVESALQLGIDRVFTLVGDHLNEVLSVAEKRGLPIVHMRHEAAVVHAADGWSRMTRRPGLAIVTGGPGHTNALTGIATAHANASPMIAVSGTPAMEMRHRVVFQDIDQVGMAAPVTKFSHLVTSAAQVPFALGRAYQECFSGRYGAAHLSIPVNVFTGKTEAPLRMPAGRMASRACDDAAAAMDLLAKAERPVVIGGSGVWWSDAGAALLKFLKRTRLPYFDVTMARGVISEKFGGHCGYADPSLNRGCVPAFQAADVVLVLGKRIDYRLAMGGPRLFGKETRFIQVELQPTEIGNVRDVAIGVVGDVRTFLEAATPSTVWEPRTAWMKQIGKWRKEWLAKLLAPVPEGEFLHPGALFAEVKRTLPVSPLLSFDGGDFIHWGRAILPALHAGGWLRLGPMATIGAALPFCMAQQMARPKQPVMMMTGDGSLGFYIAELDTMVRYGVPVVIIVGNDGGWGLERELQGEMQGTTTACELRRTRYDLVCQAFGGGGETIDRLDQVEPALARGFAYEGPYVLNVNIRGARSPFTSWQLEGKK
ncbi:MAG: thiamine pyrophosphate-binding protein [Bryobacteraceae bacterium]